MSKSAGGHQRLIPRVLQTKITSSQSKEVQKDSRQSAAKIYRVQVERPQTPDQGRQRALMVTHALVVNHAGASDQYCVCMPTIAESKLPQAAAPSMQIPTRVDLVVLHNDNIVDVDLLHIDGQQILHSSSTTTTMAAVVQTCAGNTAKAENIESA